MDDRRKSWQPPARPAWAAQSNAHLRALDLRHVVPLDEASLIDAACRATGLTDFGDDDWRAPFRILLTALEEEAELNMIGRMMTRSDLIQLLSARLLTEETYRRHPEIEDEQIVAPLLIIGQGRSGTSFLQNLLAEDPGNRAVLTWEAMFPAPPPEPGTARSDPRIAQCQAIMQLINDVTPEMAKVHEMAALVPTESVYLLALAFVGDYIPGMLGQVPSFQARYRPIIDQGIRYERRVLKMLQWRQPKRRWVLKTPSAMGYMEETIAVYPDLKLVWAHRDPIKALSSIVGMQGTLNWIRSDQPFRPGAHEFFFQAELMAKGMEAPIEVIERGIIPKSRVGNIQYRDMVADPVAAAEKLYGDLGIPFTGAARAAFTDYMRRNPREARPPHVYETGDEEQIARDRAAFRRYTDYFAVPIE